MAILQNVQKARTCDPASIRLHRSGFSTLRNAGLRRRSLEQIRIALSEIQASYVSTRPSKITIPEGTPKRASYRAAPSPGKRPAFGWGMCPRGSARLRLTYGQDVLAVDKIHAIQNTIAKRSDAGEFRNEPMHRSGIATGANRTHQRQKNAENWTSCASGCYGSVLQPL